MKLILTDDFINISHFNENDIHSYINNLLANENVYILKNSAISLKKNYYINKYLNHLNLSSYKIIHQKKINKDDFILHFWFNDNYDFTEVNNIKCRKIFHLMDYWLNSKYKREILKELEVEKIISYTSSDLYDVFFQNMYQNYQGKVMNLPFGFNNRFLKDREKIENKNCLLLGSVNPVIEIDFFNKKNREFYDQSIINDLLWFHPMRRKLSKMKNLNFCKSYLPKYPKVKNFDYNLESEFVSNSFFYCCESILNFPAAKIFEGMTSGCIPIIPKIGIYEELGFVNMENCIFFDKNNVEELIKKINEVQNLDYQSINKLSHETKKYCINNFSHEMVSKKLINFIFKI